MANEELLSRCGARSSNMQAVTRGTGGDALGYEDLAGAMGVAHLTEPEMNYLLAAYAMDRKAEDRLFYVLYDKVVTLSTLEKWECRRPGAQFLRSMLQVALGELMMPQEQRDKITDALRYTVLAVERKNWERRWRMRYLQVRDLVKDYLAGLEGPALDKLRRGLR